MSIPISELEYELWQLAKSDGLHGRINKELTDSSIIYRDGWRHGVLERITITYNKEESENA